MILKAECTGRLEPWSELGSGMGVGGWGCSCRWGSKRKEVVQGLGLKGGVH